MPHSHLIFKSIQLCNVIARRKKNQLILFRKQTSFLQSIWMVLYLCNSKRISTVNAADKEKNLRL